MRLDDRKTRAGSRRRKHRLVLIKRASQRIFGGRDVEQLFGGIRGR